MNYYAYSVMYSQHLILNDFEAIIDTIYLRYYLIIFDRFGNFALSSWTSYSY